MNMLRLMIIVCGVCVACAQGGENGVDTFGSIDTSSGDAPQDTTAPDTTQPQDTTPTPDVGPCGPVPCPAGFVCCSGECVNTAIDTRHCGACNTACSGAAATQVCQSGSCVLISCESGFDDCDNSPTNGCEIRTDFDIRHCGGCNQNCAGLRCEQGQCITETECAGGREDCNEDTADGCEIDLQVDAANCGACGLSCRPGESCSGGECRCGAGVGCDSSAYCFDGQSCVDNPTFFQEPACSDLGVAHAGTAGDSLIRYVVRGRPGAVVYKWNQHLSCGAQPEVAPESADGSLVLDENGEAIVAVGNPILGCDSNTDILGEFESWVVVDDIESNHINTTFFNSSSGCTGFDTCAAAKSYCAP